MIGALVALPGAAHANTFPGLNGKVAFASDRDAMDTDPSAEGDQRCQTDENASSTGSTESYGPEDFALTLVCGEIYTLDPSDSGPSNERRLTFNEADDDQPQWSPDGTRIAFESNRACLLEEEDRLQGTGGSSGDCDTLTSDIWVMEADGSNPQQLTNDRSSDQRPTWSPDGSKIAFESRRRGDRQIYVLELATRELKNVSDDGNADEHWGPSWSPDGSKIALTCSSDDFLESLLGSLFGTGYPPVGHSNICVVSADGSGGATVRGDSYQDSIYDNPNEGDFQPVWSPDGTRIVFASEGREELETEANDSSDDNDDDTEIFSMLANGGDVQQHTDFCRPEVREETSAQSNVINNETCRSFNPAYSPEGSRIVYHSDKPHDTLTDEQRPSAAGPPQPQRDVELYTIGSNATRTDNGVAQTSNERQPNCEYTFELDEPEDCATDAHADWQRLIPPTVTPSTPSTPARAALAARMSGVPGACVSRTFRLRVRISSDVSMRSVRVSLDGRRIKSTRSRNFLVQVPVRALRRGRHRVTVVAVDRTGRRRTQTRTFARCSQARVSPRFTG